jgi:rod shape-determining protein MreC
VTAFLATRTARRRGIAFTVLLAITLLLMAFSSNPAVLEVQRGVSFAFRPIQGALDELAGGAARLGSALLEIERLRADNTTLRDENARLAAENARLDEIRRENALLTGLLQLRNGFEYQTVAAQVIARESSEFRRIVTLDRGSDVGIAVGDIAIAQGGALVGRIVDVGPNFAQVQLITDGGSTVIGQLATSAATGEVVGQLGGVLIMNQIDSQVRIQLDEEVVTAGIELNGGIRSPYPKALLIGQVVDVRRDANDVVQTAFLLPAADLERLEFVLVITDYEGGIPPVDELPTDCSPGSPEASPGTSPGTSDGPSDEPTLPDGEQPCFTPTPAPQPSASGAP